jgi:dTDP-4-amino-4,6-dideoxygalactose transaminase
MINDKGLLEMIPVTKTFLPPITEYTAILEKIWQSKWLTNRGALTLELEEKLKIFLRISNIIITNNGTIPLQIALKLLGNNSEVITTPFSYVATTAAISWTNCVPVFVDIDPEYLTIDESKIEEAITPRTTAILATHVFGNPCNIGVIDAIAKKHNLKVIYDAAHGFAVEYQNKSIFDFGDVSTCSFHATKLFHTGEGGAIICNDSELFHQLFYSHNFGHKNHLEFFGLGINAKISELQTAMGLAVFPYLDNILHERKKIIRLYEQFLSSDRIQKIKIREGTKWNYSYFPVIFPSEELLLAAESQLNSENIIPRRYFYPSLNTLEYCRGSKMPISESISSRILCLPLYFGLEESDILRISNIINKTLSK